MAVTFLTNEDKNVLDQQIETLNDRIDDIKSGNGVSGVVVDSTLTIDGAAADAAVVGERLSELNKEIDSEKVNVRYPPQGGVALRPHMVMVSEMILPPYKLL